MVSFHRFQVINNTSSYKLYKHRKIKFPGNNFQSNQIRLAHPLMTYSLMGKCGKDKNRRSQGHRKNIVIRTTLVVTSHSLCQDTNYPSHS
jgi:hypothetical protein